MNDRNPEINRILTTICDSIMPAKSERLEKLRRTFLAALVYNGETMEEFARRELDVSGPHVSMVLHKKSTSAPCLEAVQKYVVAFTKAVRRDYPTPTP